MTALTVHARWEGLRELTQRLDRVDARGELDTTLGGVGLDAQQAFARAAPQDTGRLAREIAWRRTGLLSGDVVSPVRDPRTGFGYTGVTRFGHGEIVPKTGRALRFVIGGKVVYRRRVGPWKPVGGDWALKAKPQIDSAATRRMGELRERLIRKIVGS